MTMTDDTTHALLRLLTWLSPAFPVGAFSYSHGLERAVHDGAIVSRSDLEMWITDLVSIGSGWTDLVVCAQAWRRTHRADELETVRELAEAMAGTCERHLESVAQGRAFMTAAKPWLDRPLDIDNREWPYPVAVGAVAGRLSVPLEQTLTAFCHAFVANQVQAALRLLSLGQSEGVRAMARLETVVATAASRACKAELADLGSSTVMAEVASMRHETQYSRVFRS